MSIIINAIKLAILWVMSITALIVLALPIALFCGFSELPGDDHK